MNDVSNNLLSLRDAPKARTRNPDARSEFVSGFRVHAVRACPGMTMERVK